MRQKQRYPHVVANAIPTSIAPHPTMTNVAQYRGPIFFKIKIPASGILDIHT